MMGCIFGIYQDIEEPFVQTLDLSCHCADRWVSYFEIRPYGNRAVWACCKRPNQVGSLIRFAHVTPFESHFTAVQSMTFSKRHHCPTLCRSYHTHISCIYDAACLCFLLSGPAYFWVYVLPLATSLSITSLTAVHLIVLCWEKLAVPFWVKICRSRMKWCCPWMSDV